MSLGGVFICFILLFACSGLKKAEPLPISSTLISKTKTEILVCAGPPYQEAKAGKATILKYYKEEALLDSSDVVGKGSISGIRRRCWAHILIEDDRVTGVEFRPVPDMYPYTCQAIFEPC